MKARGKRQQQEKRRGELTSAQKKKKKERKEKKRKKNPPQERRPCGDRQKKEVSKSTWPKVGQRAYYLEFTHPCFHLPFWAPCLPHQEKMHLHAGVISPPQTLGKDPNELMLLTSWSVDNIILSDV